MSTTTKLGLGAIVLTGVFGLQGCGDYVAYSPEGLEDDVKAGKTPSTQQYKALGLNALTRPCELLANEHFNTRDGGSGGNARPALEKIKKDFTNTCVKDTIAAIVAEQNGKIAPTDAPALVGQ